MSNGDGLVRLGRIVKSERGRKFGTAQAAIREAQMNAATLKRVESGMPVRADRLAAIEKALGWPAGRAQRIIDGLEVEAAPQTFREYVLAAPLPESFRADVIRLVDAYEGGQEVSSA